MASTQRACIRALDTHGIVIRDCDLSAFADVGIKISSFSTGPLTTSPTVFSRLNIHDGITGIDLSDSFMNQVTIIDSFIHDNEVGISYGTGINQFTINEHTILFDNIVDVGGSGSNIFFHQAFDNSGLIQLFKDSRWSHPSGTSETRYEEIITDLLGMAKGRIVNSASGVFDVYDKDNVSIIYTLVESGIERIRV